MRATLRVATRGSRLALWQANWVKFQIQQYHPGQSVELLIVQTKGDRIQDRPLSQVGGKGLFVKELEASLLREEADLAVHSLKDVTGEVPEGLVLPVVTTREDFRDALIAPRHGSFCELPSGAVVGTSSLRRAAQLLHLRPDLEIQPIRGNVETRLDKVDSGSFDATLLAVAGLKRLELESCIAEIFLLETLLPALGQGVLGLELREDDPATLELIQPLQDETTALCCQAERRLLERLEGNCQVPLAGLCEWRGERLLLRGQLLSPDGRQSVEHVAESAASPEAARALGDEVAKAILNSGGREILDALKTSSAINP
ncbi:MAG: hydroxymethylbilane synthase [Deltaproteobacteria bacterium]|nr:hydroxymethylbilane synthase [Deltaproteobacteria bacterium]